MARRVTVAEAVRQGHRQGLEAMRDKLAADLDVADPAVSAQIAGRLQAVLKELADLGGAQEVSRLDELAARRQPAAHPAAPARRPSRQRRG